MKDLRRKNAVVLYCSLLTSIAHSHPHCIRMLRMAMQQGHWSSFGIRNHDHESDKWTVTDYAEEDGSKEGGTNANGME